MTCPHRAVLLVTREIEGTSTSVASQRYNLRCCQEEKHSGPHRDAERGEEWEDQGPTLSHILRQEPEADLG